MSVAQVVSAALFSDVEAWHFCIRVNNPPHLLGSLQLKRQCPLTAFPLANRLRRNTKKRLRRVRSV